jgi:hypothetical protein
MNAMSLQALFTQRLELLDQQMMRTLRKAFAVLSAPSVEKLAYGTQIVPPQPGLAHGARLAAPKKNLAAGAQLVSPRRGLAHGARLPGVAGGDVPLASGLRNL